jgi:hypothetical protein
VDKAIFAAAPVRLPAGDALGSLRAPIGAHVVESGCGIGDQRAQQHGQCRSACRFPWQTPWADGRRSSQTWMAMMASVKSALGSQSVQLRWPWKPAATAFLPSDSSCQPISASFLLPKRISRTTQENLAINSQSFSGGTTLERLMISGRFLPALMSQPSLQFFLIHSQRLLVFLMDRICLGESGAAAPSCLPTQHGCRNSAGARITSQ